MDISGKNVGILGLGVEGHDLVKYLKAHNAIITILDRKEKGELDLTGLDTQGLKFECGKYYLNDLEKFDILFRSPGVYRYLPEIKKAEKKGVIVSSAINLFLEESKAKIVGVTGTKGKGTTSSLIYQILKNSGLDVYLAGNIGNPYLELISKVSKDSIVVLEMSSFQLIDINKSPNVAVVLNITSDHMDWHKNINEYISAKENIVKYQSKKDFAVINFDYETPKSFAEKTDAEVYFFSKVRVLEKGAYVEDNEIRFSDNGKTFSYGKKFDLLLRGDHNLENICAAISASKALKVKDEVIQKSIYEFRGLEHRLELVKNIGGVTFYNDSFATGPQPTIAAIQSFKEPLTVILGGSDKFLDYDELGKVISKTKNLVNVILIGQIADRIKESIIKNNYTGKIVKLESVTMNQIVKESFKLTPRGGVVLLSPAAASFDMFKNYKDRGYQFKSAVESLQ